jgi:hypothetical protein
MRTLMPLHTDRDADVAELGDFLLQLGGVRDSTESKIAPHHQE